MTNRSEYQVLARKYRPRSFEDLVGQEALVQTLSNAIKTDRIAHAFLLTGIRGVGKTTTARIIARALNCVGEDGNGGPTTSPCGKCSECTSILEDRHPDILEMDAASRTGVDDIREIIENASYLPSSARYKVYIIDEVHMLSKNAFNALLKTLEEPPAHVKFIFATTELRKIPVTILSRCQRFDLRRIEPAQLAEHLKKITNKENAAIDDDALSLLISAAEGSVRDSLSLLDQAIAHSEGKVSSPIINKMLGTANRGRITTLFAHISKGECEHALNLLQSQYDDGADPVLILQDLLELCHLLTRLKVTPSTAQQGAINGYEINDEIKQLVETLDIGFLSRCWQMLLKGLEEVKIASHTLMAAEMILIRLTHMSALPAPADLIKQFQSSTDNSTPSGTTTPTPSGGGAPSYASNQSYTHAPTHAPAQQPALEPSTESALNIEANPHSYEDVVALFAKKEEPLLYHQLHSSVSLLNFKPGYIELAPGEFANKDLAGRVGERLTDWTGNRWIVTLSRPNEGERPLSLKEKENAAFDAEKQRLSQHPHIKPIMQTWPGAEIISINSYINNTKD